jgi:polysaccharide biosynthesis/export protein
MRRPSTSGLFNSVCASALLILTGCLVLAGCATLPDSGPSAADVVSQSVEPDQSPRYLVLDISAHVIEALRRRYYESLYAEFGDHRISSESAIGVGDGVTVTIWEAGPGGLFSGGGTQATTVVNSVSTGANSATIPEQFVGRDGGITVPYAGRVHVAGKTIRDAQTLIQEALQGKAIQPQVLVNVTHPVSSSVEVNGEVVAGMQVPLSVKGYRVLDVLALAGGVKSPVNEDFVELSRGSRTARIPLITIINNPRENIYLHPSDNVTLVHDPQTFIAYGALGTNAEIPFSADGISLAQALSKAGGLQDVRSDARGVFVFRYEPEAVARLLDPGSPLVRPGRLTPVVYRLRLDDPKSLFLEQTFRMANRDVIYVSNAPSIELQKVFNTVSGVFAPVSAAGSVVTLGTSIH